MEVTPPSRSAETFSDLLKLFSRGREGIYFFHTHMQATAPIPKRDLTRELNSAREARQISRVYVLVHGNSVNDTNVSSIPHFDDFFIYFFGEAQR